MKTKYFLFVHHKRFGKAQHLVFEHSGGINCSLLVNASHTDESWEGRNTCLWIYIYIYIYILYLIYCAYTMYFILYIYIILLQYIIYNIYYNIYIYIYIYYIYNIYVYITYTKGLFFPVLKKYLEISDSIFLVTN